MLPFATTWMNTEGSMLSETSQTEKKKRHYDLTYMWNLKKKIKDFKYREQIGGRPEVEVGGGVGQNG